MSWLRRTPFALLLFAVAACTPATGQRTATAFQATVHGGEREAGKLLFKEHCSACHGPTGTEQGMFGPSLRYESARMNFQQTVSWIEDPQPPMPALYPASLSESDVRDIAAYVQSI